MRPSRRHLNKQNKWIEHGGKKRIRGNVGGYLLQQLNDMEAGEDPVADHLELALERQSRSFNSKSLCSRQRCPLRWQEPLNQA